MAGPSEERTELTVGAAIRTLVTLVLRKSRGP
jgi:hypothetical protein